MNEKLKAVRAKIQARYLPMIEPFMGVQDIRYYLNGFLIEKRKEGGVYIVATNGHVITVVIDSEGVLEGTDRIIIRRDKDLVRAAKKSATMPPCIIVNQGRVSVAPDFDMELTDLETFVLPGRPFVEGNYPNWMSVVPDFKNIKPGLIDSLWNTKYIGGFDHIYRASRSIPSVRFWQEKGDGACIVQCPAIPEFLAVVMPMRDSDKDKAQSKEVLGSFKLTSK